MSSSLHLQNRQNIFNQSVHNALWAGNVSGMRQLLYNTPIDLTLQDGIYGETNGHRSASVYEKSRCGDAATHMLHIAVSIRCTEMVNLMLAFGIDPHLTDEFDHTALCVGLRFMSEYCWGISRGGAAPIDDILYEMHSIITLLIDAVPDVNSCDQGRSSPSFLRYAIDAVNPYVVHLLLDAGATVSTKNLYEILNKANVRRYDDEIPLHGCVKFLEACGQILDEIIPQVDIRAFRFQQCPTQSPLEFIMGTLVPVSFINKIIHASLVENPHLSRTAIVNVKNAEGNTPLYKACKGSGYSDNIFMVAELLKNGANPFIQNANTGGLGPDTVISLLDNAVYEQENLTGEEVEYFDKQKWAFAEVLQHFFQEIGNIWLVKRKYDLEVEVRRVFDNSDAVPFPTQYIGLWKSTVYSMQRHSINQQARTLKAKGLPEDLVWGILTREQQLQDAFDGFAGLDLDAILKLCVHECMEEHEDIPLKRDAIAKLLNSS
jgi:hypothetical protein